MLLENGFFKAYGDLNEIIKKYTLENTKQIAIAIAERTDRDGDGSVKVTDLWIENDQGESINDMSYNDNVKLNLTYEAVEPRDQLDIILTIYDQYDQRLLRFDTQVKPAEIERWPKSGTVSCNLNGPLALGPGKYRVVVTTRALASIADRVQDAMSFTIIQRDYFGNGQLHKYWPMFLMDLSWQVQSKE